MFPDLIEIGDLIMLLYFITLVSIHCFTKYLISIFFHMISLFLGSNPSAEPNDTFVKKQKIKETNNYSTHAYSFFGYRRADVIYTEQPI